MSSFAYYVTLATVMLAVGMSAATHVPPNEIKARHVHKAMLAAEGRKA